MPHQVRMQTSALLLRYPRESSTYTACAYLGQLTARGRKPYLDHLCVQAVTWRHVCYSGRVEDSIRMGGLAEIKTERVKAILATLKQERGSISLEYIREMEDEELKAELTR